jgi:hypothetical protein
VFAVRIGLRDPRSQKRDLGHPSISPFDMQWAQALSFLPTRLNESAAREDEGGICGSLRSRPPGARARLCRALPGQPGTGRVRGR